MIGDHYNLLTNSLLRGGNEMAPKTACACCEAVMEAARTFLQGRGDTNTQANLVESLKQIGYKFTEHQSGCIFRGKNHLASHPSNRSAHEIELAIDDGEITGRCLEGVSQPPSPRGILARLVRLFSVLKPAA